DVARADERPRSAGEQHLNAARRPEDDAALREGLPEHARRDNHRQHADAADAGKPGIVGDAESRWAGEALEVERGWEADAGSGEADPLLVRASPRTLNARGPAGQGPLSYSALSHVVDVPRGSPVAW